MHIYLLTFRHIFPNSRKGILIDFVRYLISVPRVSVDIGIMEARGQITTHSMFFVFFVFLYKLASPLRLMAIGNGSWDRPGTTRNEPGSQTL